MRNTECEIVFWTRDWLQNTAEMTRSGMQMIAVGPLWHPPVPPVTVNGSFQLQTLMVCLWGTFLQYFYFLPFCYVHPQYSMTYLRQILYFLLHYIHLITLVTSYFADDVLYQPEWCLLRWIHCLRKGGFVFTCLFGSTIQQKLQKWFPRNLDGGRVSAQHRPINFQAGFEYEGTDPEYFSHFL